MSNGREVSADRRLYYADSACPTGGDTSESTWELTRGKKFECAEQTKDTSFQDTLRHN